MTESALRQKVVSIINAWIGAVKGDAKHFDILNTYNSHKPLASGYTVQKNDAYCATTVSAAYIRAGIAEYTGTECSVQRFIEVAQKKGIWVERDDYVPKPGDALCYDWDDSGVGDCTGFADHIGIVTSVSGNTIYLTEGNMSGGKTGTRSIQVNGRYIRGYIAPDFAAIAKKLSSTEKSTATAGSTAQLASVAVGAKVRVKSGSLQYDGGPLADFVYETTFEVLEADGDRAVIGIDGTVTTAVNVKDLELI